MKRLAPEYKASGAAGRLLWRRASSFAVALQVLIAIFAIAAPFAIAGDGAQRASEYAVKAAFVYDFSKFVTWPDRAFKAQDSPISICVLGDNPFGGALDRIVAGKIVDGRSFSVLYPASAEDAKTCQIVFISRSKQGQLKEILGVLGASSVLTVGDSAGYAAQGVMINLFLENDRIRFKINDRAAQKAGIEISSKLLSLAKLVND